MDKPFVIFDMDGTLIDSMPFWRQLDMEFCRKRGIPAIPVEVLEKTAALTMTESAEVFIDYLDLDGTPESIAEEFFVLMEHHYADDIPLKEGVRAYLDNLKAKGVTMCAASATPEYLLHIVAKRLDLEKYFSFILSCETVGEGKTSPKVYFEAAGRMGARVEDTAVFEDSRRALHTAHDAGFHTVAVYDGDCAPFWKEMTELADESIRDWRNV